MDDVANELLLPSDLRLSDLLTSFPTPLPCLTARAGYDQLLGFRPRKNAQPPQCSHQNSAMPVAIHHKPDDHRQGSVPIAALTKARLFVENPTSAPKTPAHRTADGASKSTLLKMASPCRPRILALRMRRASVVRSRIAHPSLGQSTSRRFQESAIDQGIPVTFCSRLGGSNHVILHSA